MEDTTTIVFSKKQLEFLQHILGEQSDLYGGDPEWEELTRKIWR